MKKLGIIGGMSWQSTAIYYQHLNQLVAADKGGLHSCELLLYSFDFARIAALQASGQWEEATDAMVSAARSLQAGGADAIIIATNTMHKMADAVEEATRLPLFHIADATAAALKGAQCHNPLLLATKFTMEQDFYKGRLIDKHQLQVVTPDEAGRTLIHDVIYHELCQGVVRDESRERYIKEINRCAQSHPIDSVILGCTEIGLLLTSSDHELPLFDTTEIHCRYALAELAKLG